MACAEKKTDLRKCAVGDYFQVFLQSSDVSTNKTLDSGIGIELKPC